MPELPKPRTWIITPPRTLADVEALAHAEAAANGWAVKVERVVVDGQEAALVIFSEKTAIVGGALAAAPVAAQAAGAGASGSAAAAPTGGGSPWGDLVEAYRAYTGVGAQLKTATLAQWILESGRGSSVLSREHLNFGGLKFRARMVGYADPVDYRGSDSELTTYCKFPSVSAFIKGYWHFIDSGPYDGWKGYAEDGAGYIRHIAKLGYAPGLDYPAKVLVLFGEAGTLLGSDTSPRAPGPLASAPDGTGQLLRLAVVVGHNEVAKGASAGSPIGRFEYDFNSVVGAHMAAESAHYNIQTKVFFRKASSSYSKEIAEAYQAVASWGADCAVELHFNSADADAGGTEVLCRRDSLDARALASHVAEDVQAALGFGLRHGGTGVRVVGHGERGAGSLYALNKAPTVLVEPFFGSNPTECLKVAALGEQVLALAYLRGVRDWATARVA